MSLGRTTGLDGYTHAISVAISEEDNSMAKGHYSLSKSQINRVKDELEHFFWHECDMEKESLYLDNMLGVWMRNKQHLFNALSQSEHWDNEKLALVGESEYTFNLEDYSELKTIANLFIVGIDREILTALSTGKNIVGQILFDYLMNLGLECLGDAVARKLSPDMKLSKLIRLLYENNIGVCPSLHVGTKVFDGLLSSGFQKLSDNQKARGYLLLSLHPYCYLTMSDGSHWDSCYQVSRDADYSNGAFNAMQDNVSMIGYTTNDKNRMIKTSRTCVVSGDGVNFAAYHSYPEISTRDKLRRLVTTFADVLPQTIHSGYRSKVTMNTTNTQTSEHSSHYDYSDRRMIVAVSDSVKNGIVNERWNVKNQDDTYFGAKGGRLLSGRGWKLERERAANEVCARCNNDVTNQRKKIRGHYSGEYKWYCNDCYVVRTSVCSLCGEIVNDSMTRIIDGTVYHYVCYGKHIGG